MKLTGGAVADHLHIDIGARPHPDRLTARCRHPQRVLGERQHDLRRPRIALALVVADRTGQAPEAAGSRDEARVVHPPRLHL